MMTNACDILMLPSTKHFRILIRLLVFDELNQSDNVVSAVSTIFEDQQRSLRDYFIEALMWCTCWYRRMPFAAITMSEPASCATERA